MNTKIGNLNFYTARDKLERMLLFRLAQKCNLDKCYRCNQSIRSFEDYAVDHMVPWRNVKDSNKKSHLLIDHNNLRLSHKWCNTPDSQTGCGISGYIGVGKHLKTNSNSQYEYWIARLKKNNKVIYFGYWKHKKQAALARDMGVMREYDGQCVLNFEHLREFYKDRLLNNDWTFIDDYEKYLDS